MRRPERGNVCAVIVTYRPGPELDRLVEMLATQVGGVVVVDNSADSAVAETLRSVTRPLSAHLVLNPQNLGVAAALNVGVQWAMAQGYHWVLTMDQDSTPAPHLVDGLVAAFDACEYRDRLGAIGANYVAGPASAPTHRAAWFRGHPWRECTTVITSGTMLPVAACAAVGPFREAFFIDSVDHDYCLRLRAKGHRVILTREVLMTHAVGEFKRVRVMGTPIAHSDEPPLRRYYITRNRLVLIGEYAVREPRWALGEVRRLAQEAVLMLLFERARRRKLLAMALGIWHFARHRQGALDARGLRLLRG